MARQHFDLKLRELQDDVLRLGSMVEKMVMRAVTALRERDVALAQQVIAADSQADALAYGIEDHAMELISTQQPVARDLRRIASAVVIVQELERIGDHAEGIAKLSRKLAKEPPLKPLIDIPRMADCATEMLRLALQAYLEDDAALAARVWEMDDAVDDLYNQLYRELLTYMMSDPTTIERATHLLHVGHDLERVGDRVTNICERVKYIVTGQVVHIRAPVGEPAKVD
jgi:phosphate transport system protein